jgi:hypothetical protein
VGEIADILCDFRCVGLSLVIASTWEFLKLSLGKLPI